MDGGHVLGTFKGQVVTGLYMYMYDLPATHVGSDTTCTTEFSSFINSSLSF